MRAVRAMYAAGVVITVAACATACAPSASTGTASQGFAATATQATSGSASVTTAATPPAVPDGFPVFPGAELVTPPADPGLIARWIADADGAEVYDFFVRALPAAGLAIEERFPGGAAAVVRFRLPDGLLLDVSLTASGSGTQVDLRLPDAAP